jgi:hypothetical protein
VPYWKREAVLCKALDQSASGNAGAYSGRARLWIDVNSIEPSEIEKNASISQGRSLIMVTTAARRHHKALR